MGENEPGFNDGLSSTSSKIVSVWNLCILGQNDTGDYLCVLQIQKDKTVVQDIPLCQIFFSYFKS